MSFMGVFKFLGESGQIIVLARWCPINAKARSLREHAMEHHDGPAIAVKKRMAMRQIPHDLAGLCSHKFLILSVIQSIVDRAPYVLRIGE